MPKEITHWVVAEKVYQSLPNGSLKDSVLENKFLYYLAAVCFDTPYYARSRHARLLKQVADRLHFCEDEDSFKPLARMLEHGRDYPDGQLWAFICGCITHIIADSQFHPLVYHLTGNLQDPDPFKKREANIRHRQLEARLDLYLKDSTVLVNRGRLDLCLSNNTLSMLEYARLLGVLYHTGSVLPEREIMQAVQDHALIFSLFSCCPVYYVYVCANFLTGGRLTENLAAFYPPEPVRPEVFEESVSYTNPFTGEKHRESFSEVLGRTVDYSIDILGSLGSPGDYDAALSFLNNNRGPLLA